MKKVMIEVINTLHTDHRATYELVSLTESIPLHVAVVLVLCIKLFFL